MSEALEKEIESLRAHNAELLADLKKAKAAAKDAQSQVEVLTGERDEMAARVQALALDGPVSQMLERVAISPKAFALQWGQEFDFTLDGDKVAIRDKEGNPAMVKEEGGKLRPAEFTEDDIRKLSDQSPNRDVYNHFVIASCASGSGAQGSKFAGAAKQPEKAAQAPDAPVFGFR